MATEDSGIAAAFLEESRRYADEIRGAVGSIGGRRRLEGRELRRLVRTACNLREAAAAAGATAIERLADRAVALFDAARSGRVSVGDEYGALVDHIVAHVLCHADGGDRAADAPDPEDLAAQVDRFLAEARETEEPPAGSASADPPSVPDRTAAPANLQARLAEAFRAESAEHVAALRAWLDRRETGDALEDAFRCAHSLKGAARAVMRPGVQAVAHAIEDVLAAARSGDLDLLEVPEAQLMDAIDAIEDASARGEDVSEEQAQELAGGVAATLGERRRADPHDLPGDPGTPVSRTDEAGPREEATIPPPSSEVGSDPPSRAEAPPARNEPPRAASRPEGSAQADAVRVPVATLDRILATSVQIAAASREHGALEDEWKQALEDVARLLDDYDRRRLVVRARTAGRSRGAAGDADSGFAGFLERSRRRLMGLHQRMRDIVRRQRRATWTVSQYSARLRADVVSARMIPAEAVFGGFGPMVRELAVENGRRVRFRATGLHLRVDRLVLQALKDPLMHMLRNAVSHGIEPPDERAACGKDPVASIRLSLEPRGNRLRVVVEDDGRGISREALARAAVEKGLLSESEARDATVEDLVFRPGLSTAARIDELSGRGVGTSVVADTVARLKGEVRLLDRTGPGTAFEILVPLAAATHRLLLVEQGGATFAIPSAFVERLVLVDPDRIFPVGGRAHIRFEDEPVRLDDLGDAIGRSGGASERRYAVVLRGEERRIAVAVDRIVEEREALIADLDEFARGSIAFDGAVVLDDGSVALVLDPRRTAGLASPAPPASDSQGGLEPEPDGAARILVVDDSFTTRTLETSILEGRGYEVEVAVDGQDALEKLRASSFDLVISDVEMPRLDGFGLLEAVRDDPRLAEIPFILVTSRDADHDRRRGLELGADAYIGKGSFDHQELLSAVARLIA